MKLWSSMLHIFWGQLNIIAKEGRERTNRSVKIQKKKKKIQSVNIDVWRSLFMRYRKVEIKLSESSFYEASCF